MGYFDVRWEQMLKHWDRFETEVFPAYVDTHGAALARHLREGE